MEVTSRPASSMRPESGRSNPAIKRSSVVLPDPEGPTRVKNSPRLTTRSMPSTTTTWPKFFRMASSLRAGPFAASLMGGHDVLELGVSRARIDPHVLSVAALRVAAIRRLVRERDARVDPHHAEL